MLRLVAALLSVVILASCVKQKVIFDSKSNPQINQSYDRSYGFLFRGFLQTQKVSLPYICEDINNVYSVDVKVGFIDAVTSFFTLNTLYPKSSVIYCKK